MELTQQSLVIACWVLPLDTALMMSEGGVSQCQMLSMSSPQQPVQSYKQSTVCGCLLQAWLHPGWAMMCCKAGFYQHRAQV